MPPQGVLELRREQRSTRGKRLKAALEEEETKADDEFWNQDYFAEEAADVDYEEEHVSEDVPDSDFDEAEDEGDDEAPSEEDERPRKKALKPPGSAPARPKAQPKAPKRKALASDDEAEYEPEDEGDEEGPSTSAPRKRQAREASPAPVFQAPSLRKSTIARTEARVERQLKAEERKPRKQKSKDDSWRPMSQQELLAEAARTEIENIASLKLLMAMEEETKRKAALVKKQYQGPSVKFHSLKANDAEHTSLRVCNMQYPPLWLRRMRAPQPPPQPRCLVTGQAAQYRDPQSGQPYSSLAAFKRLRPQYGDATPGAPKAHVPPPRLPGQVSAVARGEQSNRSKQVQQELAEAATDGSLQPAPPQGPYELPVELMALVVDLRTKLQQGLAA